MNNQIVFKLPTRVWRYVSKHSPGILTGIGVAGMITTTVLAVKATPTALMLLEDAMHEKGDVLTPAEKVKVAWKPYIPAAVTGVASITCLIGASSVSAKRTAALAAAYQISETAMTEYREKVVETIGENKEKTVREKVNQQQIEKTPLVQSEVIETRKGSTLFLEPLSKRYFRSDLEKVRRAENVCNKQMLHDIGGSISLNEFYDELGLEHTDLGDSLGWSSDDLIDLDITPGISKDDEPCLIIGHYNRPKYGF